MKTVAKIMLAVIMVFGFAAGASAQLTISDVCKKRAQETVGQLNDYIKGMVKKNLSLDNRNRKKDAALDLFIGKGGPYELAGVRKEGVKMETTSINAMGRETKNTRLMTIYFKRLIDLIVRGTYTEIIITSTYFYDMDVSRVRQVDDDTFECVVSFSQGFIGKRGENASYVDITKKDVKAYIRKIVTDAGVEYQCTLGDVSAGETQRATVSDAMNQ